MERWFDLHLYLANWGTHRLMIRLPKRLADRQRLDRFLREVDCAELKVSGENLILDILREGLEPEDDWDDGPGWLAALTPLRADLLGGDLRLFYLLWLTAVEADAIELGETEPLSGIGPMTGALEAFARFFGIDADLIAAAAELPASTAAAGPASSDAIRRIVAKLPDQEKTDLLTRLISDPHVANELRTVVRGRLGTKAAAPLVAGRTVGELRARAHVIRAAREGAKAEQVAADRKRQADEIEAARCARLSVIARKGDAVWHEIEAQVKRRNASGYDKAAALLLDLQTIAKERRTTDDFTRRLSAIRERHARKERFIQRLRAMG